MMTVPGLARSADPVLENCKQSLDSLKAERNLHPGHTYSLLTSLRAYLALSDSIPKPYPYPEEASRQFAELRGAVARIDSHFRALMEQRERALRAPDRDNLARYAEENLRLGAPQSTNPRVVFLGDSITDGWRLNEYFPDSDFINRGISGQITGQMLGRMQSDVIELKPKAVVVLAGTNDIARGVPLSTIQHNLTMIAKLAKLHNIRVLMASVLPVHDYHEAVNPRFERTLQRPPKTILDLNDWMAAYCRKNRHTYLDYFSATVDDNGFLKKDLADDGLHPNSAGYQVMAPLVWNAIMKVVPRSVGPSQR
jgi:lysophospholipase L1-like esterase